MHVNDKQVDNWEVLSDKEFKSEGVNESESKIRGCQG